VKSEPERARELSAWEQAEQEGFDMSLIESNLRKTPSERIRNHARALQMALQLRQAVKRKNAGA